jgi:hypothetical protein
MNIRLMLIRKFSRADIPELHSQPSNDKFPSDRQQTQAAKRSIKTVIPCCLLPLSAPLLPLRHFDK